MCLKVCSAVELSGFLLCLLGAARITHRAQGIAAIGSRWHMAVTCASAGSDSWKEQADCRDVDSDSSDIFITVSSQDRYSSFQTRQALGVCCGYICFNFTNNFNVNDYHLGT